MLDSKFDWFWILVAGQKAPRVVVDDVRAAADEFKQLGTSVTDVGPQIEQLRTQVAQMLPPDVADQFSRVSRMFSDSMPDFDAGATELGDQLDQLALDVEKTNYSMIIQVSAFAASAVLALLTPFTAWLVPGIVSAARALVSALVARLVQAAMLIGSRLVPGLTRLLELAEKLKWLGRIVGAAVHEGLQEVGQEALAQGIQIGQGNRAWSNIDGQSLLASAAMGMAMGAQIRGLADLAKHHAPKVAGNFLFHGVNEAAAEATIAITAAAITGQSLDDAWMGPLSGMFSGSASRLAHSAGQQVVRPLPQAPDTRPGFDATIAGGLQAFGDLTGRTAGGGRGGDPTGRDPVLAGAGSPGSRSVLPGDEKSPVIGAVPELSAPVSAPTAGRSSTGVAPVDPDLAADRSGAVAPAATWAARTAPGVSNLTSGSPGPAAAAPRTGLGSASTHDSPGTLPATHATASGTAVTAPVTGPAQASAFPGTGHPADQLNTTTASVPQAHAAAHVAPAGSGSSADPASAPVADPSAAVGRSTGEAAGSSSPTSSPASAPADLGNGAPAPAASPEHTGPAEPAAVPAAEQAPIGADRITAWLAGVETPDAATVAAGAGDPGALPGQPGAGHAFAGGSATEGSAPAGDDGRSVDASSASDDSTLLPRVTLDVHAGQAEVGSATGTLVDAQVGQAEVGSATGTLVDASQLVSVPSARPEVLDVLRGGLVVPGPSSGALLASSDPAQLFAWSEAYAALGGAPTDQSPFVVFASVPDGRVHVGNVSVDGTVLAEAAVAAGLDPTGNGPVLLVADGSWVGAVGEFVVAMGRLAPGRSVEVRSLEDVRHGSTVVESASGSEVPSVLEVEDPAGWQPVRVSSFDWSGSESGAGSPGEPGGVQLGEPRARTDGAVGGEQEPVGAAQDVVVLPPGPATSGAVLASSDPAQLSAWTSAHRSFDGSGIDGTPFVVFASTPQGRVRLGDGSMGGAGLLDAAVAGGLDLGGADPVLLVVEGSWVGAVGEFVGALTRRAPGRSVDVRSFEGLQSAQVPAPGTPVAVDDVSVVELPTTDPGTDAVRRGVQGVTAPGVQPAADPQGSSADRTGSPVSATVHEFSTHRSSRTRTPGHRRRRGGVVGDAAQRVLTASLEGATGTGPEVEPVANTAPPVPVPGNTVHDVPSHPSILDGELFQSRSDGLRGLGITVDDVDPVSSPSPQTTRPPTPGPTPTPTPRPTPGLPSDVDDLRARLRTRLGTTGNDTTLPDRITVRDLRGPRRSAGRSLDLGSDLDLDLGLDLAETTPPATSRPGPNRLVAAVRALRAAPAAETSSAAAAASSRPAGVAGRDVVHVADPALLHNALAGLASRVGRPDVRGLLHAHFGPHAATSLVGARGAVRRVDDLTVSASVALSGPRVLAIGSGTESQAVSGAAVTSVGEDRSAGTPAAAPREDEVPGVLSRRQAHDPAAGAVRRQLDLDPGHTRVALLGHELVADLGVVRSTRPLVPRRDRPSAAATTVSSRDAVVTAAPLLSRRLQDLLAPDVRRARPVPFAVDPGLPGTASDVELPQGVVTDLQGFDAPQAAALLDNLIATLPESVTQRFLPEDALHAAGRRHVQDLLRNPVSAGSALFDGVPLDFPAVGPGHDERTARAVLRFVPDGPPTADGLAAAPGTLRTTVTTATVGPGTGAAVGPRSATDHETTGARAAWRWTGRLQLELAVPHQHDRLTVTVQTPGAVTLIAESDADGLSVDAATAPPAAAQTTSGTTGGLGEIAGRAPWPHEAATLESVAQRTALREALRAAVRRTAQSGPSSLLTADHGIDDATTTAAVLSRLRAHVHGPVEALPGVTVEAVLREPRVVGTTGVATTVVREPDRGPVPVSAQDPAPVPPDRYHEPHARVRYDLTWVVRSPGHEWHVTVPDGVGMRLPLSVLPSAQLPDGHAGLAVAPAASQPEALHAELRAQLGVLHDLQQEQVEIAHGGAAAAQQEVLAARVQAQRDAVVTAALVWQLAKLSADAVHRASTSPGPVAAGRPEAGATGPAAGRQPRTQRLLEVLEAEGVRDIDLDRGDLDRIERAVEHTARTGVRADVTVSERDGFGERLLSLAVRRTPSGVLQVDVERRDVLRLPAGEQVGLRRIWWPNAAPWRRVRLYLDPTTPDAAGWHRLGA